MKTTFRIFTCACVVSLSGCGNWDAVHMDHNFSNNNSVTIDIKSRAIISNDANVEKTYTKDGKTYKETGKLTRVCAEPSPDAMTAYAAQLSAKKEGADNLGLGLTGSYQGSAAFVGMRTQTIQLLRDQLYRLCEANMNGWIDQDKYEMLVTRNQRNTIALMAIENLAQTTQVPVVTLTSSSTAELHDNWKDASESLAKAEAAKQEIEKLPAAEKSTDENKKKLADLEKSIALFKEREKNAKQALTSGSINAQIGTTTTTTTTRSSPVNSDAVAAIKEITKDILDNDDSGYLCFHLLEDISKRTPATAAAGPETELYEYCKKVFKGEDVKEIKSRNLGI